MDEYSPEEIEAFFKRERAKANKRKRRDAEKDDRHNIAGEIAVLRRAHLRGEVELWPLDSRIVGRQVWYRKYGRSFDRYKGYRYEAQRINRKARRLTKAALKRGQDIDPDQFEERMPYID